MLFGNGGPPLLAGSEPWVDSSSRQRAGQLMLSMGGQLMVPPTVVVLESITSQSHRTALCCSYGCQRFCCGSCPAFRLHEKLWGGNYDGNADANLRAHIYALRTTVDKPFEKALIHTHRCFGYCISDSYRKPILSPWRAEVPNENSESTLMNAGI